MQITDLTTEELLVLCDDHAITVFNRAPDLETGIQNWFYAAQVGIANKADHVGPFGSMRAAALSACMARRIRPDADAA